MQSITSVNNPLVKKIQSLQQKKGRNEHNQFVIEGIKGTTEAIEAGLDIECIFINPENIDSNDLNFPKEKIFTAPEAVMKKISSTDSAASIVAIAKQLKFDIEDIFKTSNPLVIILEDIKDPGNLGTIIRTAIAAEASGIILTGDSVDLYNPKVVRSTAANLWKIPIINMPDKTEIKEIVKNKYGCTIIGTAVSEKRNPKTVYETDFTYACAVIFGSEANGLSQELINSSDSLMIIPMNQRVESLNLSISVGVVLYESYRQRNQKI